MIPPLIFHDFPSLARSAALGFVSRLRKSSATAFAMKLAAVRLASCGTLTVAGSGFGTAAGWLETGVLSESAVLVHRTATNAITPARRTAPAIHGSHLFSVREVKRSCTRFIVVAHIGR